MYFWRISFYFGFSLSKSSVLDISESIELQMDIQNDIKTLLSPLNQIFAVCKIFCKWSTLWTESLNYTSLTIDIIYVGKKVWNATCACKMQKRCKICKINNHSYSWNGLHNIKPYLKMVSVSNPFFSLSSNLIICLKIGVCEKGKEAKQLVCLVGYWVNLHDECI